MDLFSYELGKKAGGGGGSATLQEKNVSLSYDTVGTTTDITPDEGYNGMSKVSVANNAVTTFYHKVTFNDQSSGSSATNLRNLKLKNILFYSKTAEEMFMYCTNLQTIEFCPMISSSTGKGVNFRLCENMSNMFNMCSNLRTITNLDKFDVSNVGNIEYMFLGCGFLDDNTLNDILGMCSRINMSKLYSEARLDVLGLDGTQIAKCHTLPNYQAAINNGWSDN